MIIYPDFIFHTHNIIYFVHSIFQKRICSFEELPTGDLDLLRVKHFIFIFAAPENPIKKVYIIPLTFFPFENTRYF